LIEGFQWLTAELCEKRQNLDRVLVYCRSITCITFIQTVPFRAPSSIAMIPQAQDQISRSDYLQCSIPGLMTRIGEDHGQYEGSSRYLPCAVLHNCLLAWVWTSPTFAQLYIMDHQQMLTIMCKSQDCAGRDGFPSNAIL